MAKTLYAAQIICPCRKRLGIVEVAGVNNHTCSNCGRVFTMSKPVTEWPPGHPLRRAE